MLHSAEECSIAVPKKVSGKPISPVWLRWTHPIGLPKHVAFGDWRMFFCKIPNALLNAYSLYISLWQHLQFKPFLHGGFGPSQ